MYTSLCLFPSSSISRYPPPVFIMSFPPKIESAVAFALSLSAVEICSLSRSKALRPSFEVSESVEGNYSITSSTISSISDSVSRVGLICHFELGQLLV